jgi:hypothetical protein
VATFDDQVNCGTAHGTTLLIDHIGEHTGSHTIVADNVVNLSAGFKSFGAETLKIWTYTHTVTAAEAAGDTWAHTVTAVTLAKVRSISVVASIAGLGPGLSTGIGTFFGMLPCYMLDTTTVTGGGIAVAENDVISITIIEAV